MADRKAVLITGCAPGGIGHALAREFLSRGARVFATARDRKQIADLELSGAETFALDVNSADDIIKIRDQVTALTDGKLDYLVNNAGRNYTVPASDVSIDEVRLTVETNFIAVVAMCQAFIPLLKTARGTIVQIGSVAGIMPYVFGSVYNATKAALHQYSNTLRVELAPFGVKVITIVTGGVASRIARTDRTLPKGSLYLDIKEDYERRVKHSQEGAMGAERYARKVVDAVWDGGAKRSIWVGAKVWLVWFVMTFLPRRVVEFYFARLFGLRKLEEKKRV